MIMDVSLYHKFVVKLEMVHCFLYNSQFETSNHWYTGPFESSASSPMLVVENIILPKTPWQYVVNPIWKSFFYIFLLDVPILSQI